MNIMHIIHIMQPRVKAKGYASFTNNVGIYPGMPFCKPSRGFILSHLSDVSLGTKREKKPIKQRDLTQGNR